MRLSLEGSRALPVTNDQYPERREELQRHALTQDRSALGAVVAKQGERLDRVGRDLVELRDSICWFVASSERRAEFLSRVLAVGARLATVLREFRVILGYQDERMARQEEWADRLEQRMDQDNERLADPQEPSQRPERELRPLRSDVGSLTVTASAMVAADAADALARAREHKRFAVPENPSRLVLDGELDLILGATDSFGEQVRVLVEVQVQLCAIRTWLGTICSPGFREPRARTALQPPLLPSVFGQRVYREAVVTAQGGCPLAAR